VFLMIRRQKTTIFTDAKENTTVAELKRMIEGEFRGHLFIEPTLLGNSMTDHPTIHLLRS